VPEYPLLDLATQRPEPGHYVYRFFDATGLLLYIGRTGNVWERFGQHAGRLRQEWWGDVTFALTVVERIGEAPCLGRHCSLSDHASMVAREASLIADLEPRYNRRLGNRCRSGRHLMTPDNTYMQPEGSRTCKECRAERWANQPAEKRQQYAQAAKAARAAWREEHQDDIRVQNQKYSQRPETKARAKAYKHSPEGHAKAMEQQREYRNRTEVRERLNAQQRERRQRPDLKEWLQDYAKRPEVKARVSEYQGRPDVLARRNELQRERRAQEKLAREQDPA
jgi:hypothetical protein